MKNFLLFAFLLLASITFGQTESPTIISKGVKVITVDNPMPIKKPLLIIDSVEQDVKTEEEFHKKVNAIEPNTIERLEILKNEQATAKYGAKGVNGVLEIYLKKQ